MSTSLPRRRAFLVQFGEGTDLASKTVCGRVEHVDTGRSTRFDCRKELDAFVCRVLREDEEGGQTGQGGSTKPGR